MVVAKFLALLRLIRWPNLLIVVVTQYLVAYQLICPGLDAAGIRATLSSFHFLLLVSGSVFLTASGYVINDIHDQEADRYNRPEKRVLGKSWSEAEGLFLYALFTLLACATFFALGYSLQAPWFTALCPLLIVLLWWYSAKLQAVPLVGNLLVAFLCAFVPGIVWLVEYPALQQLALLEPAAWQRIWSVGLAYLLFAFFSTLFREMVKDLEDREGDAAAGYATLAVHFGKKRARQIALWTGGIFLLSLSLALGLYWSYSRNTAGVILASAVVLVPSLYAFDCLLRARVKRDYHLSSAWIKVGMGAGLLMLIYL